MNLSAFLFCTHKNRRMFDNSKRCHVCLFSLAMCVFFSGDMGVTMQITSHMARLSSLLYKNNNNKRSFFTINLINCTIDLPKGRELKNKMKTYIRLRQKINIVIIIFLTRKLFWVILNFVLRRANCFN